MTVASKNCVVVGYVSYFVGLSLMGLMIYSWSQPPREAGTRSAAPIASGTVGGGGAVVEYQNLETEAAGSAFSETPAVESPTSLETPDASEPASSPAPSAGEDEWN